jgi:hypothetical protein
MQKMSRNSVNAENLQKFCECRKFAEILQKLWEISVNAENLQNSTSFCKKQKLDAILPIL